VLLRPDLDAPMLQFAALTQYLLRFVGVDAGLASASADSAIRALANSQDADVAALALATLYIADGRRPGTRDMVAARVASEARIRSRLKLALGYFAWIQQLGGRLDRAARVRLKAVELMPTDAGVLEELGGSLGEVGDTSRALSLLSASLRLEPDRVLTHMVMGFTLQRSGDLAGARGAYTRAAELNPWDPIPRMRLATVLIELSDLVPAEQMLEDVVRLDRSNVQAQVMLARLLSARGARASALDRVAMALAFSPSSREGLELLRELQQTR
jgi:Flp pilus assembly protein TadD